MITSHRKTSRLGAFVGSMLLLSLLISGWTDASDQVDLELQLSSTEREPKSATTRSQPKQDDQSQTLTIAGVCRDANGRPLKSIRVTLYREIHETLDTVRVEQLTEKDGKFRFAGLPRVPGKDAAAHFHYFVVATSPGLATSFGSIYPYELPKDSYDFKMPKAAELRGRVTDSNGKPVAGADVWLHCASSGPLPGVRSAKTDRAGNYVIDDLKPWDADKIKPRAIGNGSFVSISHGFFTVRHPNFATGRPSYRKIPNEIDIVLEEAGIIEGRVIDAATRKPAVNLVVSMQGLDNGWQQTRTDKQGRYRLQSLLAGKYNVWANSPDRTCAAIDSIAVAAGETKQAPDIELVEGGWLEGRVVDAESGKPLSKNAEGRALRIGMYGPSRPKSGAACQSALVDERGRFRLRVAPGKNYPYIMFSDIWQRTQRREFYQNGIAVGAGEVVSVQFRVLPKVPPKDR